MNRETFENRYGPGSLDIFDGICVGGEVDKYTFVFPTGPQESIEEYIADVISLLRQDPYLTVSESIEILDLQGFSLEGALIRSIFDESQTSTSLRENSLLLLPENANKVIPIVANGFAEMAAKPGTRPLVSHDYIQDVLQNSTLKQDLPDDRSYLIFSPFNTEDPDFFTALARFGAGQFTYYQPYIDIEDVKALYEGMREYQQR
jgi:hypothetical protein